MIFDWMMILKSRLATISGFLEFPRDLCPVGVSFLHLVEIVCSFWEFLIDSIDVREAPLVAVSSTISVYTSPSTESCMLHTFLTICCSFPLQTFALTTVVCFVQ